MTNPELCRCGQELIRGAVFCHGCGLRQRQTGVGLGKMVQAFIYAVVATGCCMMALMLMIDGNTFAVFFWAVAFLILRETLNQLR